MLFEQIDEQRRIDGDGAVAEHALEQLSHLLRDGVRSRSPPAVLRELRHLTPPRT